MEGLKKLKEFKERFLKFRFNGIIAVILVFALIALILFMERSGISYNYDKPNLAFMPQEYIVTKTAANTNLKKTTLVLWDSTQTDSVNAMEEFVVILADMKVGYDAIDLSQTPFPDISAYKTAIVVMSELSLIGQNIITLNDWIYAGGRVQFALTLQKDIYVSVLESALGILESSWDNALFESIYIDKDFMVGGGRSFIVEDGYESVWAVRLDPQKVKLHAWIDNEYKTPLIWETKYGAGKIVVDNLGLCEKVSRGFYAASYSLLEDISVYPVINASTFYLDDFPSQIPSGSNEYVLRDYGATTREFYVNIWWPAMMNHADKHGIKYTGLAITCYDDNVDGTTPSEPDEGTFLTFGNMLLRQGGEVGYHGYNHQPLCMSECDYEGLYDYKTWGSSAAMESAFDELVDLCDGLFPGVNMSLYVPPSNIMSKVGEDFLFRTYPHIKTISGIYFPDGDFKFGCVQEFDVLPDGRVYQPRIISSCTLTPYMEMALVSELNMHYVNSHFTHPDDALDPERGAELGWEQLSKNFEGYLDYLYTSAPSIRNFTGSETSAAVQRYAALNVEKEYTDNKLVLNIGNFYDEGYFFIRFNNQNCESIDGGKLSHLTGDLYLLKADKNVVTINLK